MPNKIFSVLCLSGGVICNKFVIEALLASDGKISTLPVQIGILGLQGALICAGVLYLKQWYALLAPIGVGVVLLFALQFWVRVGLEVPFPEKRLFVNLPRPPQTIFATGFHYQDQISRYEARFAEIKKMLPVIGTVGYLTVPTFSGEDAKFDYGLTRYALAPLHVDWSSVQEWVIGNFPNFAQPASIPKIEGFMLIRDFGDGVALFRRQPGK